MIYFYMFSCRLHDVPLFVLSPFSFCPSFCLHAMGLSDDELPSDGSSSESDARTIATMRTSASKASQHRASKPSKKAKKDGKAKAKVKAIDPDKVCSIVRCSSKRKAKALYCINHARDVAAMKYQAEKQHESGFFEELVTDNAKLTEALEEFDRVNPKGRFRKGLIDWTQFKRRFTQTDSMTNRRAEEEWTWPEWHDEKEGMGWDVDRIKKSWQRMLDSEYERSGDGYHATIWIPKRRERMRDETRAITNEVTQGGKAVKNVKDKDLNLLKDFVKTSSGSGRMSFLKVADGGGAEDAEDSEMDEDPAILAQEEAEEITKKRGLTLALQSRSCMQKRELL